MEGGQQDVCQIQEKKVKKKISRENKPKDSEPTVEMGVLTRGNVLERRGDPSPEIQDIPPLKKKRRKKAQTIDLESEQRDAVNEAAEKVYTDGENVNRKSKRKRKSRITDNQKTNDVGNQKKDDNVTNTHTSVVHRALFSAPSSSQPLSKVFVERNCRFKSTEGLDLSHEELEEFMEVRSVWNTRDVAMRVHCGSRIIGLFCHGFLAGYAVWNIIVVYVLAGEQLKTLSNLLQRYHSLAYPAQSLLYFLLAVCTVSAFDRVNLAKSALALRGFLTLDPVALASFFYFLALILSLSQQMTSDRINLYPKANATLWPPGSAHQFLQPWIVVNLVVALLVGLAWVFISTRPDMDYTEEYLMAMELEEYPQHEEKCEIPS